MTLGDGKRKVFELLDEYGAGEGADTELELKMADFFDMAQKELALRCRIVRCVTLPRGPGPGDAERELPADFRALRRVWLDGAVRTARCRRRGTRLLLPEGAGDAELEYYALPATVDAATPDSYEFEIAEDAQQTMPFFVAAMALSTDLVQDADVLLTLYRLMVQELPTEPEDGPGRVRCALFGG